jgi:tetratricopeptide (TPR) repeat protein
MPFVVAVDPEAPGAGGAALWLGEAASILIGEQLTAQGVGTLSRRQRVLAFERLNLPVTSVLTRATTLRVAELIGASEVVFGEVTLGEALEVRARTVRLATGAELAEVRARGSLPAIVEVFTGVAREVADRTGRQQPSGPAPGLPMPLEVFEDYVKGLVAATPAAQQRFLEAAVRVMPGDARIRMALWGVYAAQGMHDKALASASAVSSQSPLAESGRFAVALSLIELGRFEGAFQALSDLHAARPNAALSNALGVVQLRRGAEGGGPPPTEFFRRAVEEAPENTDYLFNLGYAYARAARYEDALIWLREAVRLDSASGDAHLVMSSVLAAERQDAAAARELDLARLLGASEAAGAAGRIPDRLERLAPSPELDNGPPVVAAIANPARRDQAEAAAFHLSNGKAFVARGLDRDAAAEFRRAIYLAPYDHEPHLLLGQLYQRTGQLPQAIDELTVAIWCEETAGARLALARALIDSGEVDAARREIARAQQLVPNSAEAVELLDRIGR